MDSAGRSLSPNSANRARRAVRAAALEARIGELKAAESATGTTQQALPSSKRRGRRTGCPPPVRFSARSRPGPDDFRLTEPAAVRSENTRRGIGGRFAKAVPSWLTSACVHCFLLVILALLTSRGVELLPATVISGGTTESETLPDITTALEIGDPADHRQDLAWDLDQILPDPPDLGSALQPPETDRRSAITAFGSQAEQRGAALRMAGSEAGQGAQFYGIQAAGDRFVFIVDSSTSMRVKFAEAKRELEYAVRRLGQNQQFYVIFFDRGSKRLRLGKWNRKHTRFLINSRPEPDFVCPTIENIDALIQWMNSIQLEADTNPHSAVVFALNKLRPDAVFLLSDGELRDRGATEHFLLRENLVKDPVEGHRVQTIVHCVGFYSRQGEITLQRIAAANGGTYRFVEPPPLR